MSKNKTFWTLMSILTFVLLLSMCKKNDTTNEATDTYDADIQINLTDPEPSAFEISGQVEVTVSGSDVTLKGAYQIGQLSYQDIIFRGILSGTLFTMTTDSCRVSYTFDNEEVIEDITWTLPPFNIVMGSGTGTGTIKVVKHPYETVESGTFSFTVNKQD